jgi:hypothetical protein
LKPLFVKQGSVLEVEELQTHIPHTNGKDGLGKLLELGVPEEGSTIRFGLKEMDREETEQGRVAYYGFNFAELRLNCFHPRTGKPGHQLVVAVKLPKKDDVASSKILDQKILLALDVWIRGPG